MKNGFTFIDVLIGSSLILIVFLGIFTAYQLNLEVTGQSKNKIIATYIANAELEKIRNLPYASIGIQDSFPSGILEAESQISQNNIIFKIKRRVDYIVDPTDGISQPEDECPNDYKKVEIKVSSLGRFSTEIVMTTDIAPKNITQECADKSGILSVSVFDSFGVMIPSPLIEIKNPLTDAIVKSSSPPNGQSYFSLATSTYKVVVSKPNYSSERTYGIEEISAPENPHPIVLEGQITKISLSIDKLSSMNIETRGIQESEYLVIPNVDFNLRGQKIIGHNLSGNPVYKYSENHTTNSQGKKTINNLEWDSYYFSILSPNLELTEIESPFGASTTQPISLAPDINLNTRLILRSENNLLVLVQNLQTSEPIFSASVRLFNDSLGYDTTQYTDQAGKTYFIPLTEGIYNLEIQGPGYSATSSNVMVTRSTSKTVKLEQIE